MLLSLVGGMLDEKQLWLPLEWDVRPFLSL